MRTTKREIKHESPASNKVRTPWTFGLAVKDLVSPITVSRLRILQGGLLLVLVLIGAYMIWDNFLRAPSGSELVREMVEAAGGMEAWHALKSGQFTRTRNLYAESGELLSSRDETFFFRQAEGGTDLMVRSEDASQKEVWVGKDKDGFWATSGDLPADPKKTARDLGMMCDSKYCQPTCASSMAFFRFSMPFKLTDYGVIPTVSDGTKLDLLDWNPLEHLQIRPLILDVAYLPEVGKDKWRFFVDPQDQLIHKVEYYNKSDFGTIRPEEIYWTDHREVNGITFSHRWTRYWSNGKVMDETIYSGVDFETELNEAFFERPEGLDWLTMN